MRLVGEAVSVAVEWSGWCDQAGQSLLSASALFLRSLIVRSVTVAFYTLTTTMHCNIAQLSIYTPDASLV